MEELVNKTLGFLVVSRDAEGLLIGIEFVQAHSHEDACRRSPIMQGDERAKTAQAYPLEFNTSSNLDESLTRIWPIIVAANEASGCDAFGNFVERVAAVASGIPAKVCSTCRK